MSDWMAIRAGAKRAGADGGPAQADSLAHAVTADMPALVELYQDTSTPIQNSRSRNSRRARKLARRARALGFEVSEWRRYRLRRGRGMRNGDGPTVMLRADMDGLPVIEQTGLA